MLLCSKAEGRRGSKDRVLLSQGSRGVGVGSRAQEHSERGLTRWRERRRCFSTTGAGMLPRDGWQWESLIATRSHAAVRSSLPPSRVPEDPCELSFLAGAGGESAFGLSEHFLFAWLMSPSRRGWKGEAGGNFGTVWLPSKGRGVC